MLTESDAERIQAATESAQAPATRRTYASLWRNFASWCQERRYESLPAAPVAVAAYLAERAETVKPATVRLAAAAIGAQHRQHSLPNPVDTDGVKVVLAGLARQGSGQRAEAGKGDLPRSSGRNQGHGLQTSSSAAVGRIETMGTGPRARPSRYHVVLSDVRWDATPLRGGRAEVGGYKPRSRRVGPAARAQV